MMDIEEMKSIALRRCIGIAADFTEEEVKKFFPPSVQEAWQIGNEYAVHDRKERRKRMKNLKL